MSSLPCDEVRQELSAYLDGQTDPARSGQIARHLLRCDVCRELYQQLRLTAEAVRSLPVLRAPPDLMANLPAALRRRRSGPAAVARHPAGLTAAAAVVLVIVWAGWYGLQHIRLPDRQTGRAPAELPAAPGTPADATPLAALGGRAERPDAIRAAPHPAGEVPPGRPAGTPGPAAGPAAHPAVAAGAAPDEAPSSRDRLPTPQAGERPSDAPLVGPPAVAAGPRAPTGQAQPQAAAFSAGPGAARLSVAQPDAAGGAAGAQGTVPPLRVVVAVGSHEQAALVRELLAAELSRATAGGAAAPHGREHERQDRAQTAAGEGSAARRAGVPAAPPAAGPDAPQRLRGRLSPVRLGAVLEQVESVAPGSVFVPYAGPAGDSAPGGTTGLPAQHPAVRAMRTWLMTLPVRPPDGPAARPDAAQAEGLSGASRPAPRELARRGGTGRDDVRAYLGPLVPVPRADRESAAGPPAPVAPASDAAGRGRSAPAWAERAARFAWLWLVQQVPREVEFVLVPPAREPPPADVPAGQAPPTPR